MKLFNQTISVGVFVLLVFAVNARADKPIEKNPASKAPTSDRDFVTKALAADLAEIKLAERALKATSNKEVEKFARRMRDDHTKCREALLDRAREMKLGVLEGLEKEHQEKADRLSKLEGSEFDRAYMRCMVDDHEQAVRLYESWAARASDRDLSAHIKKTLPTLKEHLEQARQISRDLK